MTNPYIQGTTEVERLRTTLSIQQYAVIAQKSDTTPSVSDARTLAFINTAPVTVSRFDNGQEGQVISVLGDGQTTIQHFAGAISIANGMKIKTNTGADKLLAVNVAYSFICFKDIASDVVYWVEDSGSGGGSGPGSSFDSVTDPFQNM